MAGDRNLLLRVASAVVALPILGAVVLWREPLGFALLALAAGAVALREYAGLTLAGRPAGERAAVVVLGVAFATALYLRPDLGPVWAMIAVVLVAASALVHSDDDMSAASGRLAAAAFGVFYVGGLVAALPLVHRDAPDGAGSLWVIVAIAVTFAADTGAYFVGRALGRHKLAPAISPGKTVEGAFGGLASALAFTFIARATFFDSLAVRDCLL